MQKLKAALRLKATSLVVPKPLVRLKASITPKWFTPEIKDFVDSKLRSWPGGKVSKYLEATNNTVILQTEATMTKSRLQTLATSSLGLKLRVLTIPKGQGVPNVLEDERVSHPRTILIFSKE